MAHFYTLSSFAMEVDTSGPGADPQSPGKKRKPPRERVRASRACDRCKA